MAALRALLLNNKRVISQAARTCLSVKNEILLSPMGSNREPRSSVSGWASERSRLTMTTEEEEGRQTHRRSGAWLGALAFSFFQREEVDKRSEEQKSEDDIILLLKKAKLSMYRGQLPGASGLLHQAVALAHKTSNTQAIIYTYCLMANLAYVQGQLDKSEKLFKAAMSYMLAGGTPEDDNSIIEISLKLATIYAGQNKTELAEHGYRFCTETLEAKLQQHTNSPPDDQSGTQESGTNQSGTQESGTNQSGTQESGTNQSEELRKETRLLLGLCLDSRARYRAACRQLQQAAQDYRRALDICSQEQGEDHPQTLVLMSDLATILDLQGFHTEALPLVRRAVDLGRRVGHPDLHVLLGNLAGVLLHQGDGPAAVALYQEALVMGRSAGDQEAVEQIQQGLMEVQRRKEEKEEKEEVDLK